LRQEFYELKILDEITKLRFEGKLTHLALKWSVNYPLPFLPVVTDAPWQIIDKKKKKEVELSLQMRSKPQIFSLDLLQLKAMCLSSQEKSENLKELNAGTKKSQWQLNW
jgi:hypothetical protein